MKIASMESARNFPVGFVQQSRLFSYSPITRKRPLIESQSRGRNIDAALVRSYTTERCKIFRPFIAEVNLRRLQAAPISGSFNTTPLDRNEFTTDAAVPASASNC